MTQSGATGGSGMPLQHRWGNIVDSRHFAEHVILIVESPSQGFNVLSLSTDEYNSAVASGGLLPSSGDWFDSVGGARLAFDRLVSEAQD